MIHNFNVETYLNNNTILTSQVKSILLNDCNNNTVHCTLNITYLDLFKRVISIIETKENKNDILEIMNQEIIDSSDKCFTGKMSRLINVLNGNDERINIKISDNDDMNNTVICIKNKLLKENIYTLEQHKLLAKKELIEKGYEEKIINTFCDSIE